MAAKEISDGDVSAVPIAGIGTRGKVYTPRLIHFSKSTMAKILGAASHEAWKLLALKHGKMRVPFGEHKDEVRKLVNSWVQQVISSTIK